MFDLFLIKDHNGKNHILKSSKIHKLVMEKSEETNYDWIAPASNLVSLCEQKKFPLEYAIDMKVAILNCFAELMNKKDLDNFKKDDLDAVYYAYNSLAKYYANNLLYKAKAEEINEARSNFLKAFLKNIIFNKYTFLYRGKSYHEFVDEWINQKFEELFFKDYIFFSYIKNSIKQEFYNDASTLEGKNVFFSDDEVAKEKLNIKIKIVE